MDLSWTLFFCLLFKAVRMDLKSSSGDENFPKTTSNLGTTESPELIRSLNPWVIVPEDWTDPETESAPSFRSPGFESRRHEDREEEPFFEHALTTNVSEQVDRHLFLNCKVKNLGDRTVSWIRRRDWHILTSGRTVYTNDDRFKIRHTEGSEEWTLVIEFVQTRDEGTYECQVSTSHGTISHFFNVEVLTPRAFILGAKEYHVQQGTPINLVCILENSPRDSAQYLYWYYNNQLVNYGTRVSVHTEPGTHTHSRLTVASAGPQHSGNYTCKASNTQPASVSIFVSEGDKTAAMQGTGSQFHLTSVWRSFTPTIIFLLLF